MEWGTSFVDMSEEDPRGTRGTASTLHQVLGASEREMAEAAGISRQAWSNYISRRPGFVRVLRPACGVEPETPFRCPDGLGVPGRRGRLQRPRVATKAG